jgi:hypothetical protein
MHVRSFVLGSGIALCLVVSAQAQQLLDGSSVDEITNLARGYGSATTGTQENGDPLVTGKIDGVLYNVYFQDCTASKDCKDLRFYAGFTDNKQPMETINAWNRDTRFGKAYLDEDLDAVIEFDLNLEHGVSRENLDSGFSRWAGLLGQFTTYIGY